MKPARNILAYCAVLFAPPLAAQVQVTVLPAQPAIERSRCCHLLNFDFELVTSGPDTLVIDAVLATLLGPQGQVLGFRHVDRNGMVPSVATLNTVIVAPGKVATVFNPFFSIDRAIPVAGLRYTFQLRGRQGMVEATTTVSPRTYATRTDLVIPVQGRVLVRDGHDFYSHHRRMDLSILRGLGVAKRQFNRYAYDFSVVDSAGRLNRTGGRTNEDWFGYGTPVVAPGTGIVRVAENHVREHRLPGSSWDDAAGIRAPRTIPGNYIVIDHENGECSLLAHLKQGTQSVSVGDRVRRGQPIARMGLSGDSFWLPHVHYQLMDSCDFLDAEGLPSYFSGFLRVGGAVGGLEQGGQIDTGDILTVRPYFKNP